MIEKLRVKHKLKWLRFSMAFHRFKSITDIFKGDLSYKIKKCVGSRDFEEKPCNCDVSAIDRSG